MPTPFEVFVSSTSFRELSDAMKKEEDAALADLRATLRLVSTTTEATARCVHAAGVLDGLERFRALVHRRLRQDEKKRSKP